MWNIVKPSANVATFTKPRSAHCLNHDLTSAPMTPEERDEYLAQCWKDVTVEENADTWSHKATFHYISINNDQSISPFILKFGFIKCSGAQGFSLSSRKCLWLVNLVCHVWPIWAPLVGPTNYKEIKWEGKSSIARLRPNETETLKQIIDPAQTLWVWITSLLSRMAADGEIPAIPTPTYGRVIAMAEQAYTGIRAVRASIRVQPPYVHVQMMAALVLVPWHLLRGKVVKNRFVTAVAASIYIYYINIYKC